MEVSVLAWPTTFAGSGTDCNNGIVLEHSRLDLSELNGHCFNRCIAIQRDIANSCTAFQTCSKLDCEIITFLSRPDLEM